MVLEPIGKITFDGVSIDVYEDLDYPKFRLKDIAKLIGYRDDSSSQLLRYCEERDYFQGSVNLRNVSGRGHGAKKCTFVNEKGLYKILGGVRTQTARKWVEVVSEEIVNLRRSANRNISEQFEIWDERAIDIWFDEDTGLMMEAINLPGGDVCVRPYEK